MKALQGCLGQVAALTDKEEHQKLADLEMRSLWQTLVGVSRGIKASSTKLLHDGPAETLASLLTCLGAGEACRTSAVQVSHLAQPQQLGLLMDGSGAENEAVIGKLTEAFQKIVGLAGDDLKAQLKKCESALTQPVTPAPPASDAE
jgi:hypothetical protein